MKHIKVRAVYKHRNAPLPDIVEVEILEQTHRNREFGLSRPMYKDTDSFKHGRIVLASRHNPAYGGSDIFVRGAGTYADAQKLKIPVDQWPEVKAAIEAYNEWGATQ